MPEKLFDFIANMKEKEALSTAKEVLDSGEDPIKILELCREAMDIVGQRFEKGEYFLPELILAGKMLSEISDMVKPKLVGTMEFKHLGKVVIGTVKGDIHDIGKNIVIFMLDANGFEVQDLGEDVPPQAFVDSVKEVKPEVVGLSGLLTLTYDSMKETVDALTQAGVREGLKIMIGGAQMDDSVRQYTGADAFGKDAMDAVSLAKKWTGGS